MLRKTWLETKITFFRKTRTQDDHGESIDVREFDDILRAILHTSVAVSVVPAAIAPVVSSPIITTTIPTICATDYVKQPSDHCGKKQGSA